MRHQELLDRPRRHSGTSLVSGDVVVIRGGVWHGYRALYLFHTETGVVVWSPGCVYEVARVKFAKGGW